MYLMDSVGQISIDFFTCSQMKWQMKQYNCFLIGSVETLMFEWHEKYEWQHGAMYGRSFTRYHYCTWYDGRLHVIFKMYNLLLVMCLSYHYWIHTLQSCKRRLWTNLWCIWQDIIIIEFIKLDYTKKGITSAIGFSGIWRFQNQPL